MLSLWVNLIILVLVVLCVLFLERNLNKVDEEEFFLNIGDGYGNLKYLKVLILIFFLFYDIICFDCCFMYWNL